MIIYCLFTLTIAGKTYFLPKRLFILLSNFPFQWLYDLSFRFAEFSLQRNFPRFISREAQLEKEYNVDFFFSFQLQQVKKKKKSPKKCDLASCTSCRSPAGQSSDLSLNVKKLN